MQERYRFADLAEGDYSQKRVDEDFFSGYVCCVKFGEVKAPLIVNNGIDEVCIKGKNYVWLEIYPDDAYYAITIIFDDKANLVEWYFDIAKKVGIENGIPFEDDLYLDMVITSDGQKLILDENELLDALHKNEISRIDVDVAYQTLFALEKTYAENLDRLKSLTKRFRDLFD